MMLDDLSLYTQLDSEGLAAHITAFADHLTDGWVSSQNTQIPIGINVAMRGGLHTIQQAYDLVTACYPFVDVLDPRLTPISLQVGTIMASQQAKINREHNMLGWYVGYLLGVLAHLDLIDSPEADLQATLPILAAQMAQLGIDSPAVTNPAKRLAGQFMERLPVIYGGGVMNTVAQRWKTQLNLNAKTFALAEKLPDAAYYAIEGVRFPGHAINRTHTVFLQLSNDPFEQYGEALYILYMTSGIAVDKIIGAGESPLANALTTIQYGDFVSLYLAIAYGIDPSESPLLSEIYGLDQ